MGYIVINKGEDEGSSIRHNMRRMMHGGYSKEDYSPMMRSHEGDYEHGYRMGYRHGWEDSEDDMDDMEMRRARDSRGRYI